MKVIIEIPKVQDKIVLTSLVQELKRRRKSCLLQRIRFDICMNDPCDCVKQINLNDKKLNIWQGNGNVTCSNPLNQMPTAKYAIALRNHSNSSIGIVYHWTIDIIQQIETILFLDIDAI